MTSVKLAHDDGASVRAATRRMDRRLLARYHDHGDTAAREALVERFMPLAHQLARRYQRGNEPVDDLVQVASVGLLKAVDRFDPSRGNAFSTYAVPTILGELKRYFRDTSWALHVPRAMQERVLKLNRASDALHRRLGRSPSTSELGAELELTTEEVVLVMEAASAFESSSLDEHLGNSGDSGDATHADSLGRLDERFAMVEDGAAIAPNVMRLGQREQLILRMRFVEDLTQSEIANRMGVSQMHVSRLLRRSLEKLRTYTAGARA